VRYHFSHRKQKEPPHIRYVSIVLRDPFYNDGKIAVLMLLVDADLNTNNMYKLLNTKALARLGTMFG
jgi:hypothetical protein